LKSGETLLLHNYILVESAALLQARLGVQAAILFLNDAKAFEVEWVDWTLHQEAKEELQRIGRRGISFVDCVSFMVMKRKGMQTTLAFDPDFHHQGFSIY
jgi:predicted nucleic acid-binding protein